MCICFEGSEAEAIDHMNKKRNIFPVDYNESAKRRSTNLDELPLNISDENNILTIEDSDEEEQQHHQMGSNNVSSIDTSFLPVDNENHLRAVVEIGIQTDITAMVNSNTQTDCSASRTIQAVNVAVQTDGLIAMADPIPSTSGGHNHLVECKLEKPFAVALKSIKALNERLGDEVVVDSEESEDEAIDIELDEERRLQNEDFCSGAEDATQQFDGRFARNYGFTTNVCTPAITFGLFLSKNKFILFFCRPLENGCT